MRNPASGVRTAPIGARSRRAGRMGALRSGRIPAIRIRTSCRPISPPRFGTRRGSRSRWSGVAGWSVGRAGRPAWARRIHCPAVGPRARPAGRGTGPGARRARARRDFRRLVWLGERGSVPPCAEPDPSVPEHRARWLCPLGQQLQRRRIIGDPAAYPRDHSMQFAGAASPGIRSPRTARSWSRSAAWR